MAAQIATLGEHLLAEVALVRPCHRVLPEVVPQVAALAEDRLAMLILAPEVKFDTLCFLIENLDRLVPFSWDSCEIFYIRISLTCHNPLLLFGYVAFVKFAL